MFKRFNYFSARLNLVSTCNFILNACLENISFGPKLVLVPIHFDTMVLIFVFSKICEFPSSLWSLGYQADGNFLPQGEQAFLYFVFIAYLLYCALWLYIDVLKEPFQLKIFFFFGFQNSYSYLIFIVFTLCRGMKGCHDILATSGQSQLCKLSLNHTTIYIYGFLLLHMTKIMLELFTNYQVAINKNVLV